MMMHKRGIVPFPLLIVGVGIFLVIVALAFANPSGTGSGGSVDAATKFVCDVTVKEGFFPTLGDDNWKIDAVDCTVIDRVNSCGFLGLGIFRETGRIKLVDSSGVIASKDFTTPILSDVETVSVSACSKDAKVTIRGETRAGQFVDSEDVQIRW